MTLVIRDAEVERLLSARDCLDLLDDGYRKAAGGSLLAPPWSTVQVPGGGGGPAYQIHELRAVLPESDVWAIRLAQRSLGGKATVRTGHVLLFSLSTGRLLAAVEDEWLQQMRVAATSALGVRYLANPGASVLGVLGTGRQAERQVEAMVLARPVERVLAFSPTAEHRERFVRGLRARFPFPVEAVDSPAALLARADIVTSAASAAQPTVSGAAVRPGTHVNVVSALHVDETLLARASAFTCTKCLPVEHTPGGARTFEGESPLYRRWGDVRELEPVMLGNDAGRRGAGEITLFYANASGVQFAILGDEIHRRAVRSGCGHSVDLG